MLCLLLGRTQAPPTVLSFLVAQPSLLLLTDCNVLALPTRGFLDIPVVGAGLFGYPRCLQLLLGRNVLTLDKLPTH